MRSAPTSAVLRSSVGRNARWSVVQTIFAAVTVFVLYKFLYSHVGPELLGLWAVVLASVSLGRIAELGFSTTVLRFVSKYLAAGDTVRAATILETGVLSIGAALGLVLIVCYPFASYAIQHIVPLESITVAQDVIPFALATLWVGITGAVLQSALDGCGRMDVKSKILIAGNLLYVVAAMLAVQRWGIVGLAACQLLQSLFVGVFVWGATRRELPALRMLPLKWDKSCFREILGYAAGLQLGNLLLLLYEPATKILLSRYCGLNDVAHFEMANQVVSRVRVLITSAMQAYLPALSSVASDIAETRKMIGEASLLVAKVGLPLMAGLIVSYPVISILWIGHVQDDFVVYGRILGAGWLFATLAMPTYYYCVGAGRVRAILASQALTVSLNAGLGYAAAVLTLGRWVAASMMVSLAAGNIVTTVRALADLETSAGRLFRMAATRRAVAATCMTMGVLAVHVCISMIPSSTYLIYGNFVLSTGLLLVIFFPDARTSLLGKHRIGR